MSRRWRGRERIPAIGRVPADKHREVASRLVEDVLERAPCTIHGDLAVEVGLRVQPFEHGDVRIWTEIIRVDAGIGRPGQHLVVTRIRERQPIRDVGDAAFELIADQLATLGHRPPQERKECCTPLGWRRPPERAAECVLTLPDAAVLLVHEQRIGAGEHLLPPQPVGDDQEYVLRLEGPWQTNLCLNGICQQRGHEQSAGDPNKYRAEARRSPKSHCSLFIGAVGLRRDVTRENLAEQAGHEP